MLAYACIGAVGWSSMTARDIEYDSGIGFEIIQTCASKLRRAGLLQRGRGSVVPTDAGRRFFESATRKG